MLRIRMSRVGWEHEEHEGKLEIVVGPTQHGCGHELMGELR